MHRITKALMVEHGVTHFECHCCDRQLNPKTLTWLELNASTGEWARPGKAVWTDGPNSQGCFEFGQACARKRLALQKKG